MIEVTLIGALLAGILSFLSPCVLPLVPAYLSYISGVGIEDLRQSEGSSRRQAVIQSLWFVAGFSLVFILLGATATMLGSWLLGRMEYFEKIAGLIIIVFGLHYVGIVRIPWLMMEARFSPTVKATKGLGALALGSAFAFGWTPCIGPILGAILAIAGSKEQIWQGIGLLATYSAGLAIPFLLAALLVDQFLKLSSGFKGYFRAVEMVSGVLLLLVGGLIFMGNFSMMATWVIKWFPALANIESLAV